MKGYLPTLIALAAVALTVACSNPEEEAAPTDSAGSATVTASKTPLASGTVTSSATPASEGTLWRWGNVTILIPDGSGTFAGPDPAGRPSSGGMVAFQILKRDLADPSISSYVLLNPEDGLVQLEEVRPEHRAALDDVLSTVRVAPPDKGVMSWPYSEDNGPELPREEFMGFSISKPAPSTGLYVSGGLADPGGAFVSLTNGVSVAFVTVDPVTGQRQNDVKSVLPEDLTAFQRWLATIKRCETEIEC